MQYIKNRNLSLVLTVHNKDWLIQKQLETLKKTLVTPIEISLIFDGCTDDSFKKFIEWSKTNTEFQSKHLIKTFFEPNVFETKANNTGLKASTGNYVAIVQDDMLLNENGWFERMLKPFVMDDVFAVTARTAHDWIYNVNNQHEKLAKNLNNCWCDILIHVNHANKTNIDRETFAVRDSANRGPLVLEMSTLEKLNFLDESFSPQDMDDHDLNYRAFKEYGKVAGCYWIDFASEDSWGGTRVSGAPAPWLFEAQHKNTKIVWSRHKDLITGTKHSHNRKVV